MTAAAQLARRSRRHIARSVAAIAGGLALSVGLALALDLLFRRLGIYPSGDVAVFETDNYALALSYRAAIAVLGAYATARLAPSAPMRHAMILGGIGFVLAILGLAGAVAMDLGDLWYPAALVVTALPCAWAGGALARRPAQASSA